MQKLIKVAILAGLVSISETFGARNPESGLLFYAKHGYQTNTLSVNNPNIIGGMFQIYWSQIETADSVFNWSEFDGWLAPWKLAGKKIGIRIMWSSSGYWPDPLAATPTPSWVWDKGAVKAVHAPSGTEIPIFWDPIYNKYALRFMKECARKFDKDTSILFLDVTPGAETNPYRFGTIDESDSSFRSQFVNTQSSNGLLYSESLWILTVRSFMDSARSRFTELPLLVTLNKGSMPDEGSNLQENGDYAVSKGLYVGQNGIKGTSYSSHSSFMDWAENTSTFFEMVAQSGGTTGTLMEVMEAAVRVKASYLNVYPQDVLKGTIGYSGFDTLFEQAIEFGAKSLLDTAGNTPVENPLEGFVLTGDPESANGATWVFKDTINSVIYDLTGILLKPSGLGKFPAVIVNHGTGGSAEVYSRSVAKTMVAWGYVCIAVNYTHSANVACGSPGDCVTDEYGASESNMLRGIKCWDILAGLSYIDTNKEATFGHSRGSYITTGLVGHFPEKFAAASHTAGGIIDSNHLSATSPPAFGVAQAIQCPYIMHHGDADFTVNISFDRLLDSILESTGTIHSLHIYPGGDHNTIKFDTLMYARTRAWFDTYVKGGSTQFENVEKFNPTSIYCSPNPFNPVVKIKIEEDRKSIDSREWFVDIYNMCGQKVHSGKMNKSLEYKWKADTYPSGRYLVMLISSGIQISKHIILQK